MARISLLAALTAILFAGHWLFALAVDLSALSEVPVKGMVTMVDIGGDSCTPCKMMLPVLRELEEKYRGRAAIVAINIGKNHDPGKLLNARIIPTQIFYDREGREVSRHEGFLDRKSIVETLEKMGIGP